MRLRVAAYLAFGFLCWSVSAQAQEACRLVKYASLEMWTDPDGRVTMPLTLEGRDLRFMVDTGGVVSTIHPAVANSLAMQPHASDAHINFMAGIVLDHYVTPKSIGIGPVKGGDIPFYIEPDNWRGVDGTVAPNLLRNFDLDFDFANGKLNLFSPDHCPGKVVYWTQSNVAMVPMSLDDNNHIQIEVRIDGKAVDASLDTGAVSSVMSMTTAREYLGVQPDDPLLKKESPTSPNYTYPFKTLNFAGVSVANPYVVIFPDAALRSLGPTRLILGIDILRQLHLYIDYKERMLYLSPATAH